MRQGKAWHGSGEEAPFWTGARAPLSPFLPQQVSLKCTPWTAVPSTDTAGRMATQLSCFLTVEEKGIAGPLQSCRNRPHVALPHNRPFGEAWPDPPSHRVRIRAPSGARSPRASFLAGRGTHGDQMRAWGDCAVSDMNVRGRCLWGGTVAAQGTAPRGPCPSWGHRPRPHNSKPPRKGWGTGLSQEPP